MAKDVKNQLLSDEALRALSTKLRLYANGSTTVNVLRAEQAPGIRASDKHVVDEVVERCQRAAEEQSFDAAPALEKRTISEITDQVAVSVFLNLTDEDAGEDSTSDFDYPIHRKGNLAYAQVPLARLDELARHPSVTHIEIAESIEPPRHRIERAEAEGPEPLPTLRAVGEEARHRGGEGVLIGIVDVEGFDFSHEDFLREGNTRFERIWDQGVEGARPSPNLEKKQHLRYGSEFRKEHLDAAIDASDALGLPPYEIERQSQLVVSSHGTHVASIAAGGSGVCPNAKIAAVLLSLGAEDWDRRLSFTDSSRIAHAVEYLFALRDELGCRAVSINVSLGTNGHAHDGSSAVSRWIDSELTAPGRSVCVAAGNAGQEASSGEDDIGFIMGRIHTAGQIAASGLTKDITFQVVGNLIEDVSENELEIWYSAQDQFAVQVRPPGMSWIPVVKPGEFKENEQLPDGTFVSIYNERYHPANGANYIAIYLSPFFGEEATKGVPAGLWTVRLIGDEIRDGHFDGWIERDDPSPIDIDGPTELWSFPSFFTTESNVDRSSIGSLASGRYVIAVGNLDESGNAVNVSSSQGPTRDQRKKPDVCAPGTEVVAASGFDSDHEWVGMTGTSMASPYVAGVVGLMLAVDSTLTAAQIDGILRRTARPLPGTDYSWKNDAGYGVIEPEACIVEASRVNEKKDVTP